MNLNKKWSLKWIIGLAALIALGAMPLDEAFGQRRSGGSRGGGFRSGGSKTRSGGSKTRSGSRSKAGKSKGSRGSSKAGRGTSAKKSSKSRAQKKADRAAYEKAKKSGKAFGSRKEAMNKFKSDPATKAKYTSKYATKPATRPDHIPSTYKGPQGNTYNITYNQAGGGYGYMNTLGAFILYDALADASRASYFNAQMRNQGYYYGAAPPAPMSGFLIFMLVGGVILVFVIGGVIVSKSS